MGRRLPIFLFACLLAGPGFAQQPAEQAPVASTRCGGVFCDLYYAGKPAPAPGQPDIPDPTHLPCRDFICAAFGGKTAEPPPPPAAEPVAQAPSEPVKTAKRKRKAHKTVAAAEVPKDEPAK